VSRRLPVHADQRANVLGFDGERVTFATPGCSRDTGAVWTAAIADADTTMPRPPRCQVVWGTKPLRLDRRQRVTLRLRCPRGCRGEVHIEGRGRRFGTASFEQPARGSGRIRIQLRATSRLFGRARTAIAVLHTFYDTASENDFGEKTQHVKLQR
jgi:hypothetical protein